MSNSVLNSFLECIRSRIPIAKPYPIETFVSRTKYKFFLVMGYKIRVSGAKPVGKSSLGNSLLQLRSGSAIAKRGTIIEVPEDRVIYQSVRKTGTWQVDEARFLSRSIDQYFELNPKLSALNEKIALLDVGANIGLISMESVKLSRSQFDLILVEPHPDYVAALKSNLEWLDRKLPTTIFEVALGESDGQQVMYVESRNRGNSSLLSDAVAGKVFDQRVIRQVEASAFFRSKLKEYDKLFLKSDTQGADAMILAKMPEETWNKVQAGIIEVWPLPSIDSQDVDKVVAKLSRFKFLSWSPSPKTMTTVEEVRAVWTSKSHAFRDLFISHVTY